MQPSRRPQATAFQPVNGISNDSNSMPVTLNVAASPSLEDRFAGLSGGNISNSTTRKSNTINDHNNNIDQQQQHHERNSSASSSNPEINNNNNNNSAHQQQQHSSLLDPAKFSVTVRGNDMSAKLSSVTHRLMAQMKTVSTLRDTFENQRDNFVSQKICTLSRQLESLYSEASDIIGLMASEEPKTMPSKGFGNKNDHGNGEGFNNNNLEEQNKNNINSNTTTSSSPNNRNNNNNNAANAVGSATTLLKNMGGNINNNHNDDNNNNVSASSPSSILSLLQQHQQQGSSAAAPVSTNNNNNVMKGSRRPVAVPFSQQQQQQQQQNNNNINNNQNDDNATTHRTPTLQGTSTTSASSAMYLPGIANLDLNSNSNINSTSSTQSAIQILQHFQQNNNNNTNNNSNNNTQGHHQHHHNNNKHRQGFDLNPPPPPPPPPPPAPASQQQQQQRNQQSAPKFVRATTVITQAEQQQQQQGIPINDTPLHQLPPSGGVGATTITTANPSNGNEHHSASAVITSASAATAISAHQANLQGLNANGEQTFPGNPHRRLNRGEAHHFCVVEFKCNRMKRYPFDRSQDNVRPGHYIICWGDKGEDCGLCVMTGFCDETGAHSDMKTFRDANVELHKVRILSDIFVLRNASREEVATLHGSLAKLEEAALQRCQEMAAQRGLTMQFTDCEIQFDRQKFTFYFDACSSVDFRDLTRDLHRIFKARIWLENINGNVKNVVPEGAISQADKKMFAARGVQLKFR